jgi:hypothetical protein
MLVIILDQDQNPIFASLVVSTSGPNFVTLADQFPFATAPDYNYVLCGYYYNLLETVIRTTGGKNSDLDVTPMSMADSNQAMVNDYNGVSRTFSVEGLCHFNSLLQMSTWRDWMDRLQDGNQYANINIFYMSLDHLAGSSSRPYRVMVNSFVCVADHSDPPLGGGWLAYTLKLTERGLF